MIDFCAYSAEMRGADRGPDPFAVDALHTLLGLYVLFVTYWGKGQLCPDPFFRNEIRLRA
jgi:hypothetical protein